MGHHAGADSAHLLRMARSARLIGDTQISRVDEPDVLSIFREPCGIRAHRVRRAVLRDLVGPRPRMRLLLRLLHTGPSLFPLRPAFARPLFHRGNRRRPKPPCQWCACWTSRSRHGMRCSPHFAAGPRLMTGLWSPRGRVLCPQQEPARGEAKRRRQHTRHPAVKSASAH